MATHRGQSRRRAANPVLDRAFNAGVALCVAIVSITGLFVGRIESSFARTHDRAAPADDAPDSQPAAPASSATPIFAPPVTQSATSAAPTPTAVTSAPVVTTTTAVAA